METVTIELDGQKYGIAYGTLTGELNLNILLDRIVTELTVLPDKVVEKIKENENAYIRM